MNWKRSENKERKTVTEEGRVDVKKRHWGSRSGPVVVDVDPRVYEGNFLAVLMRFRGKAVVTREYFRVCGHTPRAVRLFGRFARVKKIAGGPCGALGTWPI